MTRRRSLDEIIEDIVDELHPLNPRAGDPRPVIRKHIMLIKEDAEDLAILRNVKAIRKVALEASTALARLKQLLRSTAGSQIHRCLMLVRALSKTEGPDPRMNATQWLCAFQAFNLVNQFSKKPPVTTQNETWHLIAQFLFEAVIGKPPSEAGLLRAVKRVARFLKN
jgi:hypothetical protein